MYFKQSMGIEPMLFISEYSYPIINSLPLTYDCQLGTVYRYTYHIHIRDVNLVYLIIFRKPVSIIVIYGSRGIRTLARRISV